MRILSCLMILVITSCSSIPWTKTDKILYGTFLVGQTLNYAGMNYIREKEEWHEINPILPDFDHSWEIAAWKTVTSAGVLWAADYFDNYRREILSGSNVGVFMIIGRDKYAGVKFEW